MRPSAVRVGSVTYRVLWDAEKIAQASDENTDDGASWGAFSDHNALVIGLNPDHAEDQNRVSMLHELLHCALRVSGAWPNTYARTVAEARDRDGGVTVEEFTVEAQAGPLLGVLRDNPRLLAWLTHEGE